MIIFPVPFYFGSIIIPKDARFEDESTKAFIDSIRNEGLKFEVNRRAGKLILKDVHSKEIKGTLNVSIELDPYTDTKAVLRIGIERNFLLNYFLTCLFLVSSIGFNLDSVGLTIFIITVLVSFQLYVYFALFKKPLRFILKIISSHVRLLWIKD